jgi:hypothetical protein
MRLLSHCGRHYFQCRVVTGGDSFGNPINAVLAGDQPSRSAILAWFRRDLCSDRLTAEMPFG